MGPPLITRSEWKGRGEGKSKELNRIFTHIVGMRVGVRKSKRLLSTPLLSLSLGSPVYKMGVITSAWPNPFGIWKKHELWVKILIYE